MNSIVVANLFENPMVLAAIVLLGALSNWLVQRRRRAGALASPNESESPPSRGRQQRSAKQPDLQDILRQLLGGEPPPALTPPPVPYAFRDEQTLPVEGDEEQFHSDHMTPDGSPESCEGFQQPLNQVAERSRRDTVVASATATRVEAEDRHENAVRRDVPFDRQAKRPGRAMRAAHRRHSSVDGSAVRLWRDPRIVRRAFMASLMFAPPKALEA
jgi:hypothetical protein